MNNKQLVVLNVEEGPASRFIKPSWYSREDGVKPTAFDLRTEPPEEYISFSLTVGSSDEEHFQCALSDLSRRLRYELKGFIALMSIEVCLSNVNDEASPIIEFREERLPHCGLYYVTENLQKILEAKSTLAYLANEKLREIPRKTQLSKS